MTKQGAHRDHFLAFLILNAVASGFNMSWAEAVFAPGRIWLED